jgi:hypothetical protein
MTDLLMNLNLLVILSIKIIYYRTFWLFLFFCIIILLYTKKKYLILYLPINTANASKTVKYNK